METASIWLDSAHLPELRKLDEDLTIDAVFTGGGITGITAAYLLKRAGLRVTLDCPCHGSRLAPDGKVLSGPAEKGLEKIGPT